MRIVTLLLALFAAEAPVLTAQSLLIVVRETLNGVDVPEPLPARETLAETLFDDGIIVFDLPGGAPPDSLLPTAAAAGADYLLELTVDFTSQGTTFPRLDAHASYSLRAAGGGAVVLRGSLDGTNEGRETSVDRPALARELGGTVAARIRERLARTGP
jgi:hypothetical protein